MNELVWLQLSAGKGPVECAWAVAETLRLLEAEARASGIEVTVLDVSAGPEAGTMESALVALSSAQNLIAFIESWTGTIQWVGKSPYRPGHKRKNWFLSIEAIASVPEQSFDSRDVSWETMRASGPGGQHVNRTESAVRVTHRPTGLQAFASEERSQHRNRSLALSRLAAKVNQVNQQAMNSAKASRWLAHQSVQRGNPKRVFHAG